MTATPKPEIRSPNDLRQEWHSIFVPRDRRPIPEWAHEFVWLSPPITKTGFFDCSDSRHFLQIFDSLQNDRKRGVNVLKPVRGGGSLIGDVFCPWTLANDPGPYMDVFQTEKVASDHAEERIKRIFEKCPPVAALFPANRHKQRDDEILFNHGHTWYVRGPSLGNLQAKGIRYLRLEEVWMWDQGKMGEAMGRIGDYLKMQTSKVLCISQGGPKDGVEMEESDWFRHYHRGLLHEWEVQCLNPECRRYFDPIFSGQRVDGSFWGITWNHYRLPSGDWDIPKCLPTIRFECPHCKYPMLEGARTKGEWNRTGQWRRMQNAEGGMRSGGGGGNHGGAEALRGKEEGRRQNAETEGATIQMASGGLDTDHLNSIPAPGEGAPRHSSLVTRHPSEWEGKIDSFHWEAVIDFPWDELVELWLDACNAERRGDLKPKLQFYQKRRAMFKDEESLLKGGLHFKRTEYVIESDWPEEKARFFSADRQEEDLYWWSVRAWGVGKTRRLGFGKAYGFAALEVLREKYKVPANRAFCDSAFLPKGDHGVYAACLKYGWIAVRGSNEDSFTHRLKTPAGQPRRTVQKAYAPMTWGDPGSGSSGRKYCPLIIFSKPQLNQKVQELIDHGHWEEPLNTDDADMEKEYALQMAARVRKTEFNARTGQTKVFWKESKNDHARDLANQQVLGAILADLVPDPAMERLSSREKAEVAT